MTKGRAVALALAASLAVAPTAGAAAPAIASGVYDDTLVLAVGPGGEVSGYFDMTQPGTPSFSCIFYLKGRLAGAAAAVATYFPDDPKGDLIRGALTAAGPGKVRVALPTEHGGCGNLWQFADKDTPADFKLQQAMPWTSVRVVKADKAYFSATPGAAHGRAYLVKGDGVGIRATQAGWVQADFVGEKHTSSGWLSEQDLYPP
jgi:hypothetical protein